ncbi:MAG: hypothetical protein K2P31_00155 [Rickettsiaceae bacterium]|jgi:hypothetical protein|nr:hypothetical protein [Rickettsiaceae bacterium]
MSIATIKKGIKRKLAMALLLPVLTSCATYNSSFSCGDARGANCMSMDRVDRMIANGEIENFTDKKKNCRGRKCKESQKRDVLLQPMTKAVVSDYQLSGEAI